MKSLAGLHIVPGGAVPRTTEVTEGSAGSGGGWPGGIRCKQSWFIDV
jgi:hypothetical protein